MPTLKPGRFQLRRNLFSTICQCLRVGKRFSEVLVKYLDIGYSRENLMNIARHSSTDISEFHINPTSTDQNYRLHLALPGSRVANSPHSEQSCFHLCALSKLLFLQARSRFRSPEQDRDPCAKHRLNPLLSHRREAARVRKRMMNGRGGGISLRVRVCDESAAEDTVSIPPHTQTQTRLRGQSLVPAVQSVPPNWV